MPNYQKMYHLLFNAITDALALAEKGRLAAAFETLREAQRKTEDMYMEATEHE